MPAASTVEVVFASKKRDTVQNAVSAWAKYTRIFTGESKRSWQTAASHTLWEYPPATLPGSHIEVWHSNECQAPKLGLCSSCYLGEGNKGDVRQATNHPPERYLGVTQEVCENRRYPVVAMVGVEPATSTWTLDLMHHGREVGARTALTTSGLGLDKARLERLAQIGTTICVSYDSAPMGHGTRNGPMRKAVEFVVPTARGLKLDAVGMVTIMPGADTMVRTVRYLTELGCTMVSFHPVETFGVTPESTPLALYHREKVTKQIVALIGASTSGKLEGARVHLETGAREAWVLLDNLSLFRAAGFVLATDTRTGKLYLHLKAHSSEIMVDLSLVRGTENLRLLWQPKGVAVTTCRAVCRRMQPVPWERNSYTLSTHSSLHKLIDMEIDELRDGLCFATQKDWKTALKSFVHTIESWPQ